MKTCTTTPFRKAFLFCSGRILPFAALLLLSLTGCNRTELKDDEHQGHHHDAAAKTTTRYGRTLPLGGGVARTYVTTGTDGKPVSVGVALSEKALTALPHDHDPGQEHGHEYVLPLPEGSETPFKVLALHWNPHGHTPAPIYTLPHFDFHFYTISDEERRAIPGLPENQWDPEPPAPQYLHPDYITGPGRGAAMGSHWIDRFTPELAGATFTHTFLMGSYQHKVIFYEPMITRDYLLSRPRVTIPIKQPQAFAQKGYYPTSYRIEHDEKAKEYRVALMDFVLREAE